MKVSLEEAFEISVKLLKENIDNLKEENKKLKEENKFLKDFGEVDVKAVYRLQNKCQEYEECLEGVISDLENCDWRCDRCHTDYKMTTTDIYYIITSLLKEYKGES